MLTNNMLFKTNAIPLSLKQTSETNKVQGRKEKSKRQNLYYSILTFSYNCEA